jgi:hypothetical protein
MDRTASVAVGVAMMGVTYAVYDAALPPLVDQRTAPPGEPHSTQAEKAARWVAGGLVVAVSLITMDATVFILGGLSVVGFSWLYRGANHGVNPLGPDMRPSHRNTSVAGVEANLGPVMAGANIGVSNY